VYLMAATSWVAAAYCCLLSNLCICLYTAYFTQLCQATWSGSIDGSLCSRLAPCGFMLGILVVGSCMQVE
jgi:hypothetical protein